MKCDSLLLAAFLAAALTFGQEVTKGTVQSPSRVLISTTPLGSAPTRKSSLELWDPKWIDHDDVQPFDQPEPVTISEKASVKFKPQLFISSGCHPYPAVNAAGETSGGLKPTGPADGKCKGSGLGSQVYGRSTWFRGRWAIMYAWYFPKERSKRHDWEHVIVWIDNPAVENPKVLAVTPSLHGKTFAYLKKVPPGRKYMNGTSVKLSYGAESKHSHMLEFTTKSGEFQDLIMWNQLSEDARRAFSSIVWTNVMMPLNNAWFAYELKKAWPFKPWRHFRGTRASGTAS